MRERQEMKKGEELSQSLPLQVGVGVLMILVQTVPPGVRKREIGLFVELQIGSKNAEK